MVDSLTLYKAQGHNVKLVEEDDTEHTGIADFYESEYDSGYGVAIIGLKNEGVYYKADDLKNIEILD